MNSRILISLLSLFSPILTASAPDARDADHYFDRRELWGRGIVAVNLPVPLALTSSDIDETENGVEINEIDDFETPTKQKIKEIQIEVQTSTENVISSTKLLSTLKPTSSSPRRKESTKVPSLEYYYKFIERNVVDESNRGGNVYITYSCCSEVRHQG